MSQGWALIETGLSELCLDKSSSLGFVSELGKETGMFPFRSMTFQPHWWPRCPNGRGLRHSRTAWERGRWPLSGVWMDMHGAEGDWHCCSEKPPTSCIDWVTATDIDVQAVQLFSHFVLDIIMQWQSRLMTSCPGYEYQRHDTISRTIPWLTTWNTWPTAEIQQSIIRSADAFLYWCHKAPIFNARRSPDCHVWFVLTYHIARRPWTLPIFGALYYGLYFLPIVDIFCLCMSALPLCPKTRASSPRRRNSSGPGDHLRALETPNRWS